MLAWVKSLIIRANERLGDALDAIGEGAGQTVKIRAGINEVRHCRNRLDRAALDIKDAAAELERLEAMHMERLAARRASRQEEEAAHV